MLCEETSPRVLLWVGSMNSLASEAAVHRPDVANEGNRLHCRRSSCAVPMAAMAEQWTAMAVHLCGGISASAAVRSGLRRWPEYIRHRSLAMNLNRMATFLYDECVLVDPKPTVIFSENGRPAWGPRARRLRRVVVQTVVRWHVPLKFL